MAAKLMRRENKIRRNQVSCKKLGLMLETMSTRKSRQKERGLERNRREKRYNWIAIYFEETIHWRYSFYLYQV